MLARDFVDDCLYNPHYGYFSTQAVIFDPDRISPTASTSKVITPVVDETELATRAQGFDFTELASSAAFEDEVARRYGEFEDRSGVKKGPGRQVWHTPTELFKVRLCVYSTAIEPILTRAIDSHGTGERSHAISWENTSSIRRPTRV